MSFNIDVYVDHLLSLTMPQVTIAAGSQISEVVEGALRIAFEPGLPMNPVVGCSLYPFPNPSMYCGGVQVALWEPTTGLTAAADARRAGAVAQGGVMS